MAHTVLDSSRRAVLAALLALAALAPPVELRSQSPAPVQGTRQPAGVMGMAGAPWLVRPERESEEHPERLLDLLDLRPGDTVADVGAGVGYFALRLARRLGPLGRVLAVDIQQGMLDLLVRERDRAGLRNVEAILGTETDPRLAPGSVDLALLVDVYHEFARPAAMLEQIRAALKPQGRLVVVEYRAEDPWVPIRPEHKMTEPQVIDEIVPCGFRHQRTLRDLPRQHVVVFTKQRH